MTVIMKLGDYELNGMLGRSGMSFVYKATDTRNGRSVALKELMVHDISANEQSDAIERFMDAGKAAMALVHPNILRTWDAGEVDGRYYIATEVFKGNTLQEFQDKGLIFPNLLVLDMILQTCQALVYAHSQGIAHRNVNPANITITAGGLVRLLDFGIARVAGATRDAATREKMIGSLAYVAPEMVQNFDSATPKSDMYALGSTLYALLTQKPVFTADSPDELLQKIANDKPLAPRNLNPSIPPPIETAINRCLQKNPSLRYNSCQEIYSELLRFRPALVKVSPPPEQYQVSFISAKKGRGSQTPGSSSRPADVTGKTAKGKFKLIIGKPGAGNGQFASPRDVAMLKNGVVAVADYENARVQLFKTDGTWLTNITTPNGKLAPIALCGDREGRVCVIDSDSAQVYVFDQKGGVVGTFGSKGSGRGSFMTPTGITVNKTGNIYVADSEGGLIHVFSAAFQFQHTIGKPGKEVGELKTPYAISIDESDRVAILEYSMPRVQVMNQAGESLRCYGQRGNEPGSFAVPRGLCTDPYGNVYIADTLNRRVQVFDPQGNYNAHFGYGGDGDGEFAAPEGLDINDNLELAVADKGNNRIQIFQIEFA